MRKHLHKQEKAFVFAAQICTILCADSIIFENYEANSNFSVRAQSASVFHAVVSPRLV